ncbi:hypothetical protein SISSUDRAFT_1052128 [Sistotremastrum suecicum HHB10207 ss-3]|uniref:F-box domain-containing protein n=1 Tax=Sistotremastrum suecicum HHB10207 ss-3 TaxID=1314776 RepID=A0A166A4B6_9AGAM|nr:hypothetical protein SISSUDRAFT_1052128 [Sistotremastrum suecicum HHB10207 ss-3]
MFPNLDGLPVELLFEILNDFTLHERAKVSQVSSHFYHIATTKRGFWLSATDAHLCPVPLGLTLETIPVHDLAVLASKDVMFSHSSARKMWIPKSHRKLGRYHLSEAETPESITPLPGGQWIITKDAYDSVLVLQKNIGDSTAMEFRIEIQGIGYGHSYYSPDNGQTVYLAILSRVYNQPTMTQGSGIVLIYHIVFPCGHNAVQAPEISLRKTLQLSSLDVIRHIEICGQLVLVHGKHRMAVVDWQSDSGFEATISFQPDDLLSSAMWPADSQIPFSIASVHLHPTSSKIIVALSARKTILGIADIPLLLPPFGVRPGSQEIELDSIGISISVIQTLPLNTRFFLRPLGRGRYVLESFSVGITKFMSFEAIQSPAMHFAFYGVHDLTGSPWSVGTCVFRDPTHYVDCTLGRRILFVSWEPPDTNTISPTIHFLYVKDIPAMEQGIVILEDPWKAIESIEGNGVDKERFYRIRAFDPIHKKLYIIHDTSLYCLQY